MLLFERDRDLLAVGGEGDFERLLLLVLRRVSPLFLARGFSSREPDRDLDVVTSFTGGGGDFEDPPLFLSSSFFPRDDLRRESERDRDENELLLPLPEDEEL